MKCKIALLQRTNRQIIYTYGLEYKNPTTHRVPITKEDALHIWNRGGFVEVDALNPEYIHIKEYSANDMW